MELRRKLDFKATFVLFYCVCFVLFCYIFIRPAVASEYKIDSYLIIPKIDLSSGVTTLSMQNGKLDTPDDIIGSYSITSSKTLLIGHSTTVFDNLHNSNIGDVILYDKNSYTITSKSIMPKNEINMSKILESSARKTIILMTCAGELYEGGDASHRLIVSAVLD